MKINWDLKHLYKNIKHWETDLEKLKIDLIKLEKLTHDYLNNASNFFSFIDFKIEVYILIEKLYCYMNRHLDLDSTLSDYRKKLDFVIELYNEYQSIDNKFENDIIDNSQIITKFLENQKTDKYNRYLRSILRRKEHIIKNNNNYGEYVSESHKIKSTYQSLFSNEIKFKNVIIDGVEKEVNRTNFSNLMLSKNQNDRKNVFNTYTEAYKNSIAIIANLYINKISNDIKISSLENYPSLLEKKLFEQELPSEIIDGLIKTINNNMQVMHNYINLKKEMTGLTEYHIYDASLSVCEIPKIEIELENAINIIKEALKVLGLDYLSIIDKMFDEGWVDVWPKNNKRAMSFTCISYVGVPYILINYNKSVDSVRTLGHEIGHGVHAYLSKKSNGFLNFEFSMFLTEIVSKVNELLVFEYMLKNTKDKEEKKYILNSIISNLGNSLFGQIMLTEFEHSVINGISEGKSIDANYLNNLYFNISKKYNGDAIIYDDNVKYGWAKIPHFIMQDAYYLYQYSIGMAIAIDIAYRILSNEDGLVEKYKEFLTLGNSVSIEDALKCINIDFNDSNYIENGIKILNEKIEVLKNLEDIK